MHNKEHGFQPEIESSATDFEQFLQEQGLLEDPLYQRLLIHWNQHGREGAKWFCINDADKFEIDDNDPVKRYLEKTLFDAGKNGLDKKTPWNTFRRRKAGLPMLFWEE